VKLMVCEADCITVTVERFLCLLCEMYFYYFVPACARHEKVIAHGNHVFVNTCPAVTCICRHQAETPGTMLAAIVVVVLILNGKYSPEDITKRCTAM
jgi:hypothetical protein